MCKYAHIDSLTMSCSQIREEGEGLKYDRRRLRYLTAYAINNGICFEYDDLINEAKNIEVSLLSDEVSYLEYMKLQQIASNIAYVAALIGYKIEFSIDVEYRFDGEMTKEDFGDFRSVDLKVCDNLLYSRDEYNPVFAGEEYPWDYDIEAILGMDEMENQAEVSTVGFAERTEFMNPLLSRKDYESIRKILSGNYDAEKNGARRVKCVSDFCNIGIAPTRFDSMSAVEVYNSIRKALEEANVPSVIIKLLCPALRKYCETGEWKPVILVGKGGVGKTKTAQIIADIVGLPFKQVSATNMATSFGLGGCAPHYTSADCGVLTRHMIDNSALNVAFLVDEIDKCQSGGSGVNLEYELLSVCDGTSLIHDKFMGIDVNTSRCMIFLTANDERDISPYLRDRCEIIHFPEPTLDRIKVIILNKFYTRKNKDSVLKYVDFDESIVTDGIDVLWERECRSFRAYEHFLDELFREVERRYFESNGKPIVSKDIVEFIVGNIRSVYGNKIGF
ncbi:MAG: AAA family ATPase [Saccharofermentans sp.]|nr:AAA family ATPase [Saccharofermentans sp.]